MKPTFMDNMDVIDFYSKYSEQFDQKIGSLDLYNQSYIDFVNMAKDKDNLLDLACGTGNVSKFIKGLVPKIEFTCVDLSDKMLDLAKRKLGSGNFYQSDILDLKIPLQYYDIIVCAFGLPYIKKADIATFVSEIDRFSHSGSIVYVSCMQGDTLKIETMSFAHNEKVLVYYHDKETILENFYNCGYELFNYKEQNYLEKDGSMTIDMIFNFIKQ